jgi:sugar/nucleoside kinase (ribokinase family)
MKKGSIAVIGGANIEYIIKSQSSIVQGSKNFVDIEELYGGSGLNYSLRLMSAGESVYPILYLGDDNIGHNIQQFILKYCDIVDLCEAFINDRSFFVKNIKTIRSMIIVEGDHRTILAQDQNIENLFFNFVKNQVKKLPDVSSVIIGHIHNDKKDFNEDRSTLSTLYAIEYFSYLKKFIYCNFGATQIEYGFEFWKDSLRSIDFIQMNIHEAKKLFKHDGKNHSLLEIVISFLELDISGVITLDKFGAIGFIKSEKNKIYMARPIELGESFVDSTGAGDAFCSGMVSSLNGNKDFNIDDFKDAMDFARSSSIYACKFYGGANHCPTKEILDTFHSSVKHGNEVLEYCDDRVRDILSLIDFTIEELS